MFAVALLTIFAVDQLATPIYSRLGAGGEA
jgi:hypothetical protein